MRFISSSLGLLMCNVFALTAFAQPDLEWGVAQSYSMILSEVEPGSAMDYYYKPGEADLFTPLYVPELKKYSQAFLTHVEEMRSLKSYVGPLGVLPPSSLGYFGAEEALEMIANGKLAKVGRMYFPSDHVQTISFKEDQILRNDEVFIADDEIQYGKDTSYTEDLLTGEMVPSVIDEKKDFYEAAIGGGFIEEWEYNRSKGSLDKDIKYLSLYTAKFGDLNGEYRGLMPMFSFKAGDFKKRNLNGEGLIKRDIEYQVLFNTDFDEDQPNAGMAVVSSSNGYIEPTDRFEFLLEILSGVKTGQLSIYDYNSLEFQNGDMQKAKNALYFDKLSVRDTAFVEDLVSGERNEIVVTVEYELQDIVGIRFFEDWYIDAENLGMYKRINGIVLLRELRDELTGDVKGVTPYSPYYIKLNPKM